MAKTNPLMIVAIVVIGFLLFNNAGTQTSDDDSTVCGVDPSITFTEVDKFDSAKPIGASIEYRIDDGASKTDADGVIPAGLGSKITVLSGAGNTSYVRSIYSYDVEKCGVQEAPVHDELIQNTSMTITCFNSDNNKIDGTDNNESVAAGESESISCRIEGVSQKGAPEGAVLVVELSGTTYEEDLLAVTGSVIGSEIDAPGAYTLAATANKVKAYDVDAIVGSGHRTFAVDFKAEDDQEPGFTSDLTIKLYAKGGYVDEEDGSAYKIGVEDEDQTYTVGLIGSATIETA